MNTTPFNRRAPTVARVRSFWRLFVLMWWRLGEVHAALTTAPTDEQRWWRLWHFDDRGRHITHPWRSR